MKRVSVISFLLAAATFSATSHAGLKESSEALCQKFRECAYAEMEQEELTPEMKAMMEGMLNQMCASFVPSAEMAMGNAVLERKAEACFNSMQSMSCDALTNMEGETPACRDLEETADRIFSR